MKYVVMECHEGYAVLMDEGAGFVHAANLHYQVGQTVTNPLLMQEAEPEKKHITVKIMPVLAAAACLAVVSAAGIRYYSRNVRTHSVVLMSSDANITMYLNQQGEVLSLKSDNEYGTEILKNYDAKHKSKTDVANDLLAMQIQEGHLSEGDTVDIYISADNYAAFDTYKEEFETEIQQVKVSVQSLEEAGEHPKPGNPDPKTDPKPDPKKDVNKDPKADPKKDADKPDPAAEKPAAPDAPAAPKADPPAAVKPGVKQKNQVILPPAPVKPADPPAVKEQPSEGEEDPLQTPPVPSVHEDEEKPDPAKESILKPDEKDKPDTEVKPDETIIPAPAKPEEQEGGKPAQPAPEAAHAVESDTEEEEPEELRPPRPRPEPANGLLPKSDSSQKPEPLEANA